jgi:hypothetical protein
VHGRWAVIAVLLILASGAARGEKSNRQLRPLTFSGAGNLILPSVGADLSYQLHDRFAIGVQATQLLWAHDEVSIRTRFFVVAERTWGLYVGANLHGWYSPLILETLSPLATGELGYEHRSDSGFTLGVGLGAGVLYERRRDRPDRSQPVGIANLRIGKSW